MIVRIDETGRDDEASRFDHARAGRNLDSITLPGRDDRVTLQNDDRILERGAS